jgi:hypothetical protein
LTPGEYSSGWYAKFNKWHRLCILLICGKTASADYYTGEAYLEEFNQLVTDKHLLAQQVYNADETSLFWRYLPLKTVVTPQVSAPSGFKESKEKVTMLACSNEAGTHKARLLAIGKSRNSHALQGVRVLPVTNLPGLV